MDSYPNDEAYHSEPEVSSNRPPQFNESSCGYRCGWGCCEPSAGDDEGGGGESNTPTLVDAEEDASSLLDADDDDGEDAEQQDEVAIVVEAEDGAQTIAYLENNLRRPQFLMVDEHSSISSHQYMSPDGAGSQEDGASSGAHSDITCDGRRIIDFNVSDVLRGISDRMEGLLHQYPEGDRAGPAPSSTLFRVPPLRLSAQYEHCRGNPYRHMAIRDDMVLHI
ncbi:hypothetical protein BKA63DRAFT_286645 [Paraphoma chrysanthemicola]|nr:hypothetical protein BKA63DRAFT_286645 [Paraphoma chrysanthemicola]